MRAKILDDRTVQLIGLKALGALAYRLTGERLEITVKAQDGQEYCFDLDDNGVKWISPATEPLHDHQRESGCTQHVPQYVHHGSCAAPSQAL